MENRILPPPPSGPRSAGRLWAESDFWAGLFLDLTLRIEWLGEALDAVPREAASAESLVRLRHYSRGLEDLRPALAGVHAHRADPDLKPFFDLAGPLAGFLSRLYAWCGEIGDDFERMAVALRRGEPISIVFSHKAVNTSYAQFEQLFGAMRHARHATPTAPAAKVRELDERLEELIWAIEWVHLALARPPGG